MSKKNQMSYSSFWLDSSLFGDDENHEMNSTERKSSDLMKLMAYKRSISNFVSIVTGKSIPVTFDGRGDDSYTDGEQVVISAKLDDKEFDPVVGLALHEGSHISLTDFETLTKMKNGYLPSTLDKEWLMAKYGCSDEYELSRFISNNLKSLLNYVEDRRIDNHIYTSAPGYRGYYESMYDKYFHSSVIDKGLQSSEKRTEDWDSYMFRIINLTNSNRDLNALKGLREIWDVLDLRNISRLKSSWDALEVAGEILMIVEKNISSESQGGESEGGGDGKSQGVDQNGQSPMGGNTENQPTSNNSMDASGSGEGSESDSNDGDGSDETSESGGSTFGHNPHGAGGQYEPLSDRQRRMLENAIQKQEQFLDGDIKKTKISKGDKNKIDQLDKADIKSEVTGKGLQQSYYGSNTSAGVQTYVINNLNKGLIESNMIGMLSNSDWRTNRNEELVQKGILLGTQLGKKLKTRNEERVLTTPRMKSGKLSGRMIHEIGFGNFDIFEQTMINKSTPVLLHISIDASSSMSGSKWDNTQIAAIAIAKAASMTENINVVISYRGIYYSGGHYGSVQPLMLIAYDSRKDKFSKIQQLFKHITYDGTTPEGLCYEAILKELTRTKNGTDTYLINFSDGYPGFDNKEISYGGHSAIEHTADQVKKIRQAGVKVLSYFISESSYDYGSDNFKKMYGKDSEFIDVSSVAQLAKTLNKKFEVNI